MTAIGNTGSDSKTGSTVQDRSTSGRDTRPKTSGKLVDLLSTQVFSTCPMSKGASPSKYLQEVINVARWSEAAGCHGILVYADNGIVDPWLVAQSVIQNTETIRPLIAVQPVYMHPYTVAKMITSIAFMHGRQVCLNMIAGGFRNDLLALDDQTPHDERYDRLVEYTTIFRDLLQCRDPVTFEGDYYKVHNLKLQPEIPKDLIPEILISGSSDAGLNAAQAIGATAIQYPKPPGSDTSDTQDQSLKTGIRVGIIARSNSAEAWRIAEERFPQDRMGEITHCLAMKTSDSQWHKQLSQQEERPAGEDNPYWMRPFHTYKTFCPYLVGSYEEVAQEISAYREMGHSSFILDIPPSEEELEHIGTVFQSL